MNGFMLYHNNKQKNRRIYLLTKAEKYFFVLQYQPELPQQMQGVEFMAKNTGKSIVKGTMILIAGNIVVKIIGALFKLPLANIIGADGMGLYNASFTVFDIFLVMATSGYTLAISKMVSSCCARGRDDEALEILKATRRLFFVIGLFFTTAMFVGARVFSQLIGNTRSFYCIVMLAPAVLFISLMCAYRGYYQGTNDMIPTTISQVVEALLRLIVGLSLSWYLKSKGYGIEIVSAGAILGITLGEFSSTFTLAMIHRVKQKGRKPKRRASTGTNKIFRTLFATSIPIGISGIIISVINILDNSIVMHRLQFTGCTEQQANTLYGAFNMSFTVFSLPLTIVMAVATSVFPVLSYANACKNRIRVAHISEASLRIIMMVSTAAAAVFISLSNPIITLLYIGQPRDAKIAAPLLMLMAPAAVVISLSLITSTILQAVDKLLTPSRSMIVGGAVCLVSNWFLVGNPNIGIYGVPVGICICYFITTVMNLAAIKKCEIRLSYHSLFFKPFLPAAILAITGAASFYIMLPSLGLLKSTCISLPLSLICYLLVLFISGTVERGDIKMLPGGKKIIPFIEKLHLMPKEKSKVADFSQNSSISHNLILQKLNDNRRKSKSIVTRR
jgi:stage V sporulation protein B